MSLDLSDKITARKPPQLSQRTSARKTGSVVTKGRTIEFCSVADGTALEGTDKNSYPNGVKTLVTHVSKINTDGSIDVFSNASGTIIRYKPKKIYINTLEDSQVTGKLSDIESGDCIMLKNYLDPGKISLYAFQ